MAGLSKEYGHWKGRNAAEYMADYYRLNKETMKAKARANYRANAARAAERYRLRRSAILERLRNDREGAGGARMQAEARKRYARNTAPAIARANKRRAIKLRAAVGTDREAYRAKVRQIKEAAQIACHWCARDVPNPDRRIDHIAPLSKGGSDAADNLCCACRLCNARKADKAPDQWMAELLGR